MPRITGSTSETSASALNCDFPAMRLTAMVAEAEHTGNWNEPGTFSPSRFHEKRQSSFVHQGQAALGLAEQYVGTSDRVGRQGVANTGSPVPGAAFRVRKSSARAD